MDLSRVELDKSLEIIQRLQAILQRDGELEHDMMFLLIRNVLREDNQHSWGAEHLSEHSATTLFDSSQNTAVEL